MKTVVVTGSRLARRRGLAAEYLRRGDEVLVIGRGRVRPGDRRAGAATAGDRQDRGCQRRPDPPLPRPARPSRPADRRPGRSPGTAGSGNWPWRPPAMRACTACLGHGRAARSGLKPACLYAGLSSAASDLLAHAQRTGHIRADLKPGEMLATVYAMAWAARQVPGAVGVGDRLLGSSSKAWRRAPPSVTSGSARPAAQLATDASRFATSSRTIGMTCWPTSIASGRRS